MFKGREGKLLFKGLLVSGVDDTGECILRNGLEDLGIQDMKSSEQMTVSFLGVPSYF